MIALKNATVSKISNQANYSWQQVFPVFLILLFYITFLYRETGFSMVQIWSRSDTFAHSFLVFPISIWLIWRKRNLLCQMVPKAEFLPLILLLPMAFFWFLGTLASVNSLTQISFVAMLVVTVPAMLGWRITNVILFPLGFLFFSVPLGEFLMPQLMDWTAKVTVLALRLSGIPVYREGLQFVIASGHWSVVEACSGIRYLIASLTVGTLYAYLSFRSFKKRLLFILVSILVPVIANWMRAYLIVMLGHVSGNKLASGFDHLIYGWIFFGIVIFAMFIIGARWSESQSSATEEAGLVPVKPPIGSRLKTVIVSIILVILVSTPLLANLKFNINSETSFSKLNLPYKLGLQWLASNEKYPSFKPTYQMPDSEANQLYSSDGQTVGLYIGLYEHQTNTRKLVSSSNVLVTSQDAHWAQLAQGAFPVVLDGTELEIKTTSLQRSAVLGSSNPDRILVWKIYWIGGLLTTNDYLAKVYAVWRRLTGHNDDSAVIILYTNDENNAQAHVTLASFLRDSYDSINSLLLAHVNNSVNSVALEEGLF